MKPPPRTSSIEIETMTRPAVSFAWALMRAAFLLLRRPTLQRKPTKPEFIHSGPRPLVVPLAQQNQGALMANFMRCPFIRCNFPQNLKWIEII